MPFDYETARKDGWGDSEIADFLATKHKFDVTGARRDGYQDGEIVQELLRRDTAPPPPMSAAQSSAEMDRLATRSSAPMPGASTPAFLRPRATVTPFYARPKPIPGTELTGLPSAPRGPQQPSVDTVVGPSMNAGPPSLQAKDLGLAPEAAAFAPPESRVQPSIYKQDAAWNYKPPVADPMLAGGRAIAQGLGGSVSSLGKGMQHLMPLSPEPVPGESNIVRSGKEIAQIGGLAGKGLEMLGTAMTPATPPQERYTDTSFLDQPSLLFDPVYMAKQAGQAGGSMAAFLLPVVGVFGRATSTTTAARALAAQSVAESLANSSEVYDQIKAQGGTDQQAADAFRKNLPKDLAFTWATNKLGLFNDAIRSRYVRGVAGFVAEPFQEVGQGAIGRSTTGRPLLEGAEMEALGGMMGGAVGAAISPLGDMDGQQQAAAEFEARAGDLGEMDARQYLSPPPAPGQPDGMVPLDLEEAPQVSAGIQTGRGKPGEMAPLGPAEVEPMPVEPLEAPAPPPPITQEPEQSPEQVFEQVRQFALDRSQVGVGAVSKQFGITKDQARAALDALAGEGLLESTTLEGGTRTYRNPAKARTPRQRPVVQKVADLQAEAAATVPDESTVEGLTAEQSASFAEAQPRQEEVIGSEEEQRQGQQELPAQEGQVAEPPRTLPADFEFSQQEQRREQKQEEEPREFSSTQVNLPEAVAEPVRRAAAQIPDEDLSHDGREDNPHVTVKYGLHDDQADRVRAVLADEPPIKVKLGEVTKFPEKNDRGFEVVKFDVDSPDLHRLNKKIADAVPHTDTFPTYEPHVTLAYVKPGTADKYVGKHPLTGTEIELDRIVFSGKDRTQLEIPLGGKRRAATQVAQVEESAPEVAPTKAQSSPLDGGPALPGDVYEVSGQKFTVTKVTPDSIVTTSARSGADLTWTGAQREKLLAGNRKRPVRFDFGALQPPATLVTRLTKAIESRQVPLRSEGQRLWIETPEGNVEFEQKPDGALALQNRFGTKAARARVMRALRAATGAEPTVAKTATVAPPVVENPTVKESLTVQPEPAAAPKPEPKKPANIIVQPSTRAKGVWNVGAVGGPVNQISRRTKEGAIRAANQLAKATRGEVIVQDEAPQRPVRPMSEDIWKMTRQQHREAVARYVIKAGYDPAAIRREVESSNTAGGLAKRDYKAETKRAKQRVDSAAAVLEGKPANTNVEDHYHRGMVEVALRRGKPVSDEVLADYPDLIVRDKESAAPPATKPQYSEAALDAAMDIRERKFDKWLALPENERAPFETLAREYGYGKPPRQEWNPSEVKVKSAGKSGIEAVDSEFTNLDGKDDYLYHVTTPAKARQILQDGFLPDAASPSMAEGFYRDYSKGKVFFSDRDGVSYWKERIGAHLEYTGKKSNLVVLRVPRKAVGNLAEDTIGAKDSGRGSFFSTAPVSLIVEPKATEESATRAEIERLKEENARLKATPPKQAAPAPQPKPEAKPAPVAPKPAAPVEPPSSDSDAKFREAYRKALEPYEREREEHFPIAAIQKAAAELAETGKTVISLPGGRSATVKKTTMEVEKRIEPKTRRGLATYKKVKSPGYEVRTAHRGEAERTYEVADDQPEHADYAVAKALARAAQRDRQGFGFMENEVRQVLNSGGWVKYYEKQNAVGDALKAAFPGKTIPSISTAAKIPNNPTLQDALTAVAESLPRNLDKVPVLYSGEDYAIKNHRTALDEHLKRYERDLELAAPLIGKEHPRVQELQKLVDEARAESAKKIAELGEDRRKQKAADAKKAEDAARKDAEYYAHFGATADLPSLATYAKLSEWTEKGEALYERALKEFGIEKNQLEPLDVSGVKLTKGELDKLREVRLFPDNTYLKGRLTVAQEAEWKERGWLDAEGILLTQTGKRAVLGVLSADAANAAGRPFSEYKPGSGRLEDPGESRFAMKRTIPFEGKEWITNGHWLIQSGIPKYWKAPTPAELAGKVPDISRAMPKDKGKTVEPVAWQHLDERTGNVVVFSDGTVVNGNYYDSVNKIHKPDEWTHVGKQAGSDALQAWKNGERIALLMPMRTEVTSLGANTQRIVAERAAKDTLTDSQDAVETLGKLKSTKKAPTKEETRKLANHAEVILEDSDASGIAERLMKDETGTDFLTMKLVQKLVNLVRSQPATQTQAPMQDYLRPEVRNEMEAARTEPEKEAVTKFKEFMGGLKESFTRQYRHLPPGEQYAEAKLKLNVTQKAKGNSIHTAAQTIIDEIGQMSPDEFRLFLDVVALNDLTARVTKQEKDGQPVANEDLPWKLKNKAELFDARNEARRRAALNPKVAGALALRKHTWEQVRNAYIEAMESAGEHVDKTISRKDYFRHRVLEYLELKNKTGEEANSGDGKRFKTPVGRGWLKKATVNARAYSLDYVRAEYEVLQQMMWDTARAEFIGWVSDPANGHNIAPELRRQAAAHNKAAVMPVFQAMARKQSKATGKKVTAEQMYRRTMNQKQAIAMGKLNKLAAAGAFANAPARLQPAVRRLASGKATIPQTIPLATWAMKNSKDQKTAMASGMLVKAIADKKRLTKQLAGKNYIGTLEQAYARFAKETHVIYQPHEGHHFFFGQTVSDAVAEAVATKGSAEVTEKDLQKAMIRGQKRKQLVIPRELDQTMKEVNQTGQYGYIDQALAKTLTAWKTLKLVHPLSVSAYNIRNLSGDLERIVTVTPGALKQLKKAANDIIAYKRTGHMPSPEFEAWWKRGGMGTNLQVAEISEVNRLDKLEHLLVNPDQGISEKAQRRIVRGWRALWGAGRTATDVREALLRYSAFLHFQQDLAKNSGKPSTYAASIREEVNALKDQDDKAWKLSNDLMLAYDEVSYAGQWIRSRIIPFWSFQEQNARAYYRMVKNAAIDGRTAAALGYAAVGGAGAAARIGAWTAFKVGKTVALALGLKTLLTMFAMSSDDEEDLPESVQKDTHVLLGKDDDGRVVTFPRVGLVDDVLEWAGLEAVPFYVRQYLRGEMTINEVAIEMAKSPVNKLAQGLTPVIKMPGELAYGKAAFPDAFNMRTIRDRGEYIARELGLQYVYRKYMGKPQKQLSADSIVDLFVRRYEPAETHYYAFRTDLVPDWKVKHGKGGGGDYAGNERAEALADIKGAVRYEDAGALAKALQRFKEAGGTRQNIQEAIDRLHPLGSITSKADRKRFQASLTPGQQAKLKQAISYWEKHYNSHRRAVDAAAASGKLPLKKRK